MKLKAFAALAIILSIFCLFSKRAEAASARFTPSLEIGYQWNDNIQAVDRDQLKPIAAQWADYMVGLEGSVKSQRLSFALGGHAGFSQYLSSSEDLKKLVDMRVQNLSYLNLNLSGSAQYLTPSMSFEIDDKLLRNRLFSQIFGFQNSDFSDFLLYTDNLATAQWRFQGKSKISGMLRYDYEITMFDAPAGNLVSRPGNSYAHTGYAKFMYRLSPKANVGVDLEAGERLYDDYILRDASGNETRRRISDYSYYQPLLDFDYKFSPKSSLTVTGGMQSRHFFNQSGNGPTLKDYTIPIARISYDQAQPYQYQWDVRAEYSSNTYGINLYFQYWQVSTELRYYIRKPLSLDGTLIYKQDTYSIDQLDAANVWKHNRLDNLFIASAGVHWDALRKAEITYLSFNLMYNFLMRDSNIVHPDDYVSGYPGQFIFYNTQVNSISAQVIFSPTVLIGPR